MSKLDGAGDLGEQVVNIIQAKAIVSDAKRSSIEKPQEEQAPPAPAAGSAEKT